MFTFQGSFLQVYKKKMKKKKKEQNEENEQLFEDLYFRNDWHNLLQIWYVFSPNMMAPTQ